MNKEIKGILDYLKDDNKSFIICGVSYYKISDYKAKVLLDYITNLQEEIKIMVKDDERSQKTIIRLSKENKRLKEWKEDLLQENIELENIRKEAIEYIQNHIVATETEDILLNILQGDK